MKKDASEEIEPDARMGTRKIGKLPGTLKLGKGKKDNKVVFVAGASGKVGSRVVRLAFLISSGWNIYQVERPLEMQRCRSEALTTYLMGWQGTSRVRIPSASRC